MKTSSLSSQSKVPGWRTCKSQRKKKPSPSRINNTLVSLRYTFFHRLALHFHRTTYKDYVVSRPDLYDLLWRHVPRENIRLGKRVLSYVEEETSITVNCSDNSAFCGDILVGADGAYSAVRQHLYKKLKATTGIPRSDDIPLPFSCVCLVGQTTVLDPEDFPDLKSEKSHFTSVLGLKSLCTVRI